MAREPRSYATGLQLSTTPVDIVPAVASGVNQSEVDTISFYNSSTTTNRTVTVYKIPSGGSAATTNTLQKGTIPPQKSWVPESFIGVKLENGQKIQAAQDAGTDVNAECSGGDYINS